VEIPSIHLSLSLSHARARAREQDDHHFVAGFFFAEALVRPAFPLFPERPDPPLMTRAAFFLTAGVFVRSRFAPFVAALVPDGAP
jgi:hypothetical protein